MSAFDDLSRYANTSAVYDGNIGIVRLHNTNIVRYEEEEGGRVITLDSGGWNTTTTKKRMNEAFKALGLRIRVYQENYRWYVSLGPAGNAQFYDGMRLTQAFGSPHASVVPR